MEIGSLDTPAATVDLDAVERNIARMQGYCDEHGLAFRPHIKTHKLPAVAHMQVRAGAVGITCQKLGEAEVMEAAGLRDILLSFPLVGAANAERLAALAGEAIEARGLRVERVSAGGTPTHLINHLVGEVTEVRAGTYVYGDRSCIANGSVPLEDCALRIRATVVSRPTPDRAILDSGSKTL